MIDAVLRRQSSNVTNKAGDVMDMTVVKKDDAKVEEEQLPKPPRCVHGGHDSSNTVASRVG